MRRLCWTLAAWLGRWLEGQLNGYRQGRGPQASLQDTAVLAAAALVVGLTAWIIGRRA